MTLLWRCARLLSTRKKLKSNTPVHLTQLAGADETIKVPSVGDRPPRDLSRQSLAEVVEPRYDELFTLVQAELRRSGYEDMVPAGVVLTGGTSKMEGVVELAEEIFHMPVRVGYPQTVRGLHDIVRNPIYATSVGLLQYGMDIAMMAGKSVICKVQWHEREFLESGKDLAARQFLKVF